MLILLPGRVILHWWLLLIRALQCMRRAGIVAGCTGKSLGQGAPLKVIIAVPNDAAINSVAYGHLICAKQRWQEQQRRQLHEKLLLRLQMSHLLKTPSGVARAAAASAGRAPCMPLSLITGDRQNDQSALASVGQEGGIGILKLALAAPGPPPLLPAFAQTVGWLSNPWRCL